MSSDNLTVTSEIHVNIIKNIEEKPVLSSENVVSKFEFRYPPTSVNIDEEGDLKVQRRHCVETGHIAIEHKAATNLKLVGLQVWRGALVLSDFILHHGKDLLNGKVAIELGSGAGLTSIVAAMFAKEVISTDIELGGILELIRANVKRNEKIIKAPISVVPLDFFSAKWSPEIEKALEKASIVLVGDVIYDNDVTEAFVNSLTKILSVSPPKTAYIALEKRYVFTITDLDVVAPCYEHFLQCLKVAQGKPPGSLWKVQEIPIDFPQYFQYERVKQMVLWCISS